MKTRRALALAAGITVLLVPGAPAHATDLFASPTGNGSGGLGCTQSSPPGQVCSLAQAVAVLSPGDDLTLLGGSNYPPIESTLVVDAGATVHGSPGAPATIPTIETVGAAMWVMGGAVARDVRIIGTDLDTGVQIFDDGMIERVFVDAGTSAGANACLAVNDGAVFRDSVCWTRGASGAAVSLGVGFGASHAATLRNVTAASTGSNGAGIRASAAGASSTLTVHATNTIAVGADEGTLADVYAQSNGDSGASATVILDHSNFTSSEALLGGAIADGGGNVSDPPVFVNPAVGLFGEQASSAGTIDRGTGAAVNGIGSASLALSGQARCLGSAPDIGAEEFEGAPCATGTAPPPPPPPPPPGAKKCPKGKKLKKIRGKRKCVKNKKKRRRA